jgi:peptidoglycan-N-acetylglucosamine deacetylase
MEEKSKITLNYCSMLTKLISASMLTGLTAGGYMYAAHSPTSQLFGRTLTAGSDPQEVALTFDDGPNDPYTPRLLDLLARYHVRATFFLMGSFVRQRPAIARDLLQAGHLLANHTVNHPSLLWEGSASVREELTGCSAIIEDATGKKVEYFRPPFGARRPEVLRIARELGLAPVMWNVTAHDWDATDSKALAARVQNSVQRNQQRHSASNILLHDGGHLQLGTDRSVTLATVGMLLGSWAASDLRFVTVDAWKDA